MYVDVGGLDPIINDLKESVIFPLCYPSSFKSSAGLFGSPKGVLLYGPPGCGKTMLAKTLAKESGAMFINIKPSDLSSKVTQATCTFNQILSLTLLLFL